MPAPQQRDLEVMRERLAQWLGSKLHHVEAGARTTLWWNGIDVPCRIHRLDWRGPDFDFLVEPGRGLDPLARQLDGHEEFCRGGMKEPGRYPLIQPAQAWLRESAPPGEPVRLWGGDAPLSNQRFCDLECVAAPVSR